MPSEHQHASESREYTSEAHRHVCEWPETKLEQVHPMVKETARAYLAACNREDSSEALKEHFAECVREAPF